MKSYKDYMLFDKLPQTWCAGCSHGIVLQSIAAVMAELEVDKHDMALVSGIGCFGRVDDYLDINCMHVTHGRALAAATGVALGNPNHRRQPPHPCGPPQHQCDGHHFQ